MLAGSEGLVGIAFDFELAQRCGIIALAFILFSGGAGTAWPEVRPVLGPGVALGTAGVLLSAVFASTTAAAVFAILRSRGVAIVPRLR